MTQSGLGVASALVVIFLSSELARSWGCWYSMMITMPAITVALFVLSYYLLYWYETTKENNE